MALVPLAQYPHDPVRKLSGLCTKPIRTKPPVPITGLLGLLPTELVDAVCAAVLRMGSSWFSAFTRTCKGVRRSVGHATVIEFLVRRHSYMLPGPALLDKACSYTEHVKLKMRNRADLYALSALVTHGATHCANPNQACCRDARRRFNRIHDGKLRESNFCKHASFAPGTLLMDALGGRASFRADVAAPGRARILCGTPAGAVIRERDDVRLVASRRADVFAPGRELASVHLASTERAEERGAVAWAAAEGDRVAVCTRHASHGSRYTVRLWGAHGRDLLGEHTLEPVTLGVPLANMRRMFMCKGAVWLMLTHVVDFHDEEVQFVRIVFKAGEPPVPLIRRATMGIVHSVSVASESGHVAFLEINREDYDHYGERVAVFDPDRVETHRITEEFGTGEHAGAPNELAIAPNGRVIVMLLRDRADDGPCRGDPEVVVYQREGDAFSWKVRVSEALPFGLNHGPTAWGWHAMRSSDVTGMVFSPCGATLLVLFEAEEEGEDEDGLPGLSAGLVALNVEEALRTGRVLTTGTRFETMDHGHMPLQLVWSDGLFLGMPGDEGVVRVGLAAA